MKKLLLLIIVILFNTASSYAAYPEHLIGVEFSTISGSGISWQINYDKDNTFKINGIAIYYGQKPPTKMDIIGSIGCEYQFNIWKIPKNRMFLFSGISYNYLENRNIIEYYENEKIIEIETRRCNNILNLGIGLGYEIKFLEKLSINTQVGYQYQLSDGKNFSLIFDRSLNKNNFSGVGIGLGLRIKL